MGKEKGEKYRHSTSMKHTVDSFIHRVVWQFTEINPFIHYATTGEGGG